MSIVFYNFHSLKDVLFDMIVCVLLISFVSVGSFEVTGGVHDISALCAAVVTDAVPERVFWHN